MRVSNRVHSGCGVGSTWLFAAMLACAQWPVQAQDLQDAARVAKLAREVTRIADEYIASYARSFPESAELNGLAVTSHAGLSDTPSGACGHGRRSRTRGPNAWLASMKRRCGAGPSG